MKNETTEERAARIAAYRAELAEIKTRVRAIARFKPGEAVRINPAYGRHVAAGATGYVERVDLDHTHIGGHTAECFVPERIDYSLVYFNADNEVVFRCRETQPYLLAARS